MHLSKKVSSHELTAVEIEEVVSLGELLPAVREYCLSLYGDLDSVNEIFSELIGAVRRDDSAVLVLVDMDAQTIVGYSMLKLIDQFGESQCFVVQLYADDGLGSSVIDACIAWGKNVGCESIIGFSTLDNVEALSRLLSAEPWKVLLRREI